jgi:hypothetical protein
MGLLDKIGHAVSKAAISAGTDVVRSATLKKDELELSEIINRYDECYIIIGKRIAAYLRNGETIEDAEVQQAFERIKKLDLEKAEKEQVIRDLKSAASDASEAEELLALEATVEKDVQKCKERLEMGVDSQQEFDRHVAALRNKIKNFKQHRALDQARKKGLISEDEHQRKTAALLVQPIIE